MSGRKYWLGFNLVKGIGPARLQALLSALGSAEAAWQAGELQLARAGLDRRTIGSLLQTREQLDLDRALAQVEQAGIDLLTWESPAYPVYLREIPQAPPLLYVQGALQEQDRLAVAIVGTRRLTSYGRQVTQELAAELARHRVTVISGLARGIDAVAHRAALEAGGRTIAVLGSGLDCIYPAEHRRLAQKIRDGRGAVISEYGLGVQPEARNFPPRNRIISGLSLGVVVVEAGVKSGALITSNFALEQGREVFALPGPISSPASRGTNWLIQEGAKLVTGVADILEELQLTAVQAQTTVQLALPENPAEAAILQVLTRQPQHVDDLCRSSGLATSQVTSTLAMMELKGLVRQVAGMQYVLVRDGGATYQVAPW